MTEQRVVRARLLGGFDITLPDGTTAGPWERPAARRLVAYLLLRPLRAAGREELSEALFPNLDPERASNALSKALTMARSALQETARERVLEADRSGIRFAPQVEVVVDLDEHRAVLTGALSHQPGTARTTALAEAVRERLPLLPEEPYAEWVLPVRDELEQLRLDALLEQARAAAPDQLAPAWSEVAAADPANEEACAALLRHYIATGQRDRAVRTFHRCRAALREDLEVEPSAELAALADEALRAPVATAPARHAVPRELPVPPGRRDLLESLVELCENPHRPRALSLGGPAGIGKTHLVAALSLHLEARGWTVAQVIASPDDHLAPYAGLRQLLTQLEGTAADALGEALGKVSGPNRDVARALLADELVSALDSTASAAPVAVVLDDAHWSDEAQRAVVARACRGPARRWLFVVVSRTDEPQASAPELPLDTPRFAVPPIADAAMRELVRAVAPGLPAPDVDEVVRRSAGNPFFGLELARDSEGGDDAQLRVPDRIAALLQRRISTCTAPARQLLPLVALAGPDASYELMLDAAEDPTLAGSADAGIRALDDLTAAHLLVETRSGLRLLHPLLRDAALTTINPIRRGALHSILADSLQEKGIDALAVARHRLAAFTAARLSELAPAAAEAGFEAARQARLAFANEAATELLRGALDAYSALRGDDQDRLRPGAVTAWITLADIHLDADDPAAATTAARVAVDLAATDLERAEAWRMVSGISYRLGDFDRAGAALERGLQSLHGDAVQRARLQSDLGWCRHRAGRWQEARQLYDEARPVLEAADEPRLLAQCLDRLSLSWVGDDPELALSLADRALSIVRESGEQELTAVVVMHRAECLGLCGRTGEALIELDAATAWWAATRDHYMQSVTQWVRAKVLVQHGDLAGALDARDAEIGLLEQVGNAPHLVTAHLHRAELLAALGQGDDVAAALDQARVVALDSGDRELMARVEAALVPAGRIREG